MYLITRKVHTLERNLDRHRFAPAITNNMFLHADPNLVHPSYGYFRIDTVDNFHAPELFFVFFFYSLFFLITFFLLLSLFQFYMFSELFLETQNPPSERGNISSVSTPEADLGVIRRRSRPIRSLRGRLCTYQERYSPIIQPFCSI